MPTGTLVLVAAFYGVSLLSAIGSCVLWLRYVDRRAQRRVG